MASYLSIYQVLHPKSGSEVAHTMNSLHVESLFGVAGKVVLVTGGSRGIGKMVSTLPVMTGG
jgi:hypothetical protein